MDNGFAAVVVRNLVTSGATIAGGCVRELLQKLHLRRNVTIFTMREERTIKCVFVGDGTVGKTCLLLSYTKNRFHTDYVPTIFDDYTADINVDGVSYTMELVDTPGQDDYDRLRPLNYPGTDVFLLCFAVDSPVSFNNVRDKWIPELQSNSSGVPILLIGNKSDLRPMSAPMVSKRGAVKLVRELNLSGYYECSALTQYGVRNVFDQAIAVALGHRSSEKRFRGKCSLL